ACWAAAWDMTRDAELAAGDYRRLLLGGIDQEADIGVVQTLHAHARVVLWRYADPEWAPTGWRLLADRALAGVHGAAPGSDHQLAWARLLAHAARDADHLAVLAGLLDGSRPVDGLTVDTDLRWTLLQGLVAAGAAGPDEITAELARDHTATGPQHAAAA